MAYSFTEKKRIRKDFSKLKETLEIPYLLATQIDSYRDFLQAEIQPAKMAAMESLWETQTNAPMYLFLIPDESGEKNAVELIGVPGALSFLATGSTAGEVKGLKEFAPEGVRPHLKFPNDCATIKT